MKKEEIIQFSSRFNCGDIVTTTNSAKEGKELYPVQIWAKYPMYAVVTNGNYKWCRHWTDLMATN